jgi:hypothetical protein
MIDPRQLRLSLLPTPSRKTLVFLNLQDLAQTDARLQVLSRPYLAPADYVVLARRGGRVRLLPLVSRDISKLPFSTEGADRSGYAGILQGELRAIPQFLDVAEPDLARVAASDLMSGSHARRLEDEEFQTVREIEAMLVRHGLARRSAPLHHVLNPGRN